MPQTTSVSKCTRLQYSLSSTTVVLFGTPTKLPTGLNQKISKNSQAGSLPKNWLLDYPSLCVSLNLKSLSARRQIQKLKLCYKILTNNSCLPSNHFTPHPYPSPWCPNSKQLLIPYARTSAHKASYFIDTAKLWNTLPEDIISAPSLDSFKNRLSRFYTSISQ